LKKDTNPLLRPVGARPLKSASDTLRPYLAGAKVLDLFAGQGRFGKMALEEGAEYAVFVEKDPRTAANLKKELVFLGSQTKLLVAPVFPFLEKASELFDVVFADPPFEDWKEGYAQTLFQCVSKVLNAGSIFLVKHPTRVVLSAPPPGFLLWKQSEFGESTLTYYRYEA
jgi:16S rRNA (guanine966-N2)-methyltransferase